MSMLFDQISGMINGSTKLSLREKVRTLYLFTLIIEQYENEFIINVPRNDPANSVENKFRLRLAHPTKRNPYDPFKPLEITITIDYYHYQPYDEKFFVSVSRSGRPFGIDNSSRYFGSHYPENEEELVTQVMDSIASFVDVPEE